MFVGGDRVRLKRCPQAEGTVTWTSSSDIVDVRLDATTGLRNSFGIEDIELVPEPMPIIREGMIVEYFDGSRFFVYSDRSFPTTLKKKIAALHVTDEIWRRRE
jgi:hypothetical protein